MSQEIVGSRDESRRVPGVSARSLGSGGRSRSRLAGIILVGAFVAAPSIIHAQTIAENPNPPDLRYRPWIDGPVTAGAAAAWWLPELTRQPTACRWCERSADGRDTLNRLDAAARRALRWRHPGSADRLSDLSLSLAIAVPIGVLAVSHDDFDKGFGRDVLIVCEATTISGALTQGAKYALRRERPWAHFADAPPGEELGSAGSNLSFFSGHASTAFAVVASSGAIASMRGDRAAPWIWGTGLGLAATTGYLRIAADRHYLTDVVAGAVVGTAVGLAVPHLLHRKQGAPSIQVPPALEPSAMLAGMVVRSRAPGRTGMTVGAGIRHGGPVFTASWAW
jgi:membrane-associated phospholipid phosphatase